MPFLTFVLIELYKLCKISTSCQNNVLLWKINEQEADQLDKCFMKTLYEILFLIYGEEEQLFEICVFAVCYM